MREKKGRVKPPLKKKKLKRGDKINELGVVLNFIVFKIL
jgi:hypothetical protein